MGERTQASFTRMVRRHNLNKEMENSHDKDAVCGLVAKRKFSAIVQTQQRLGGLASAIFRSWKGVAISRDTVEKKDVGVAPPDETGNAARPDQVSASNFVHMPLESEKGEWSESNASKPQEVSFLELTNNVRNGADYPSQLHSPISEDDVVSPKCIVSAALDWQQDNTIFAVRTIKTLQRWIEVSPRSHSSICAELELANISISGLKLPSLPKLTPVHASCPFLPIMDLCGIRPQSVVLGASYFQRLLRYKPEMMYLAKNAGWFPETFNDLTGERRTEMRAVFNGGRSSGMLAIYATCIYIAAKFSDTIAYKGMLSALLHAILHSRVPESVVRALGIFSF
jgi:hypothetical protein